MKKISLRTSIFLLAVMLLCPAAMTAQTPTVTYYGCPDELGGVTLESICRVSCNGQYAVTSSGLTTTSLEEYAGAIWNRDTGEWTVVNESHSTPSKAVILCDVANDGTIVGAHPVLDYSISNYQWKPAVYKDGTWTDLPLPGKIHYSEYASSLSDIEYTSVAKRITPDGSTIVGDMYILDDNILVGNETKSVSRWEPVVWKLNSDGDWDLQTFYQETQEAGIYGNQGFIAYDISHDGKYVVGETSSVRGDNLPAMINVETGKVSWIVGPELKWNSLENRYSEFTNEENNEYREEWWDGIANCIDANNNVYYYYSDGDGKSYSYIWNIDTNEKESLNGQVVACGNGELVIGMNKILKGDTSIDLSDIYTVLNMSDDGTVLAGGGYYSTDYGYESNYPLLAVVDYGTGTGISAQKLTDSGVLVSRTNNGFEVKGEYDDVMLVNAAGQIVAKVNAQGTLVAPAGGLYIVKVVKGGKTSTYKMAK